MENEIREELSELKEIDRDMYEYILRDKIEFNKLKVLKRGFEQTVKRYIARSIGSNGNGSNGYLLKIIEEYKKRVSPKEFIQRINIPSGTRKILFMTSQPTFNIVRQSNYLRKEGYETFLLMDGNLSLINFYEKYFDLVYVFDSIYSLHYILKEAEPYLIHVQGTTRNANYFGALAKLFSKSKVVFNFYDIPSTTITEDEIAFAGSMVGGEEVIKLDLFSEKYACEKCDGLIFGYSEKVGEILKGRHSISSPVLEFNSYPCDEFIREANSKYSDRDDKIHLVYGGNVAPSRAPEEYFGDCQFHGLIDQLTGQGLYFDIHILYTNFRKFKQDYGDYLLKSEKNLLFNFKQGMILEDATKEFSKYDFGLMIYHFNKGGFDKGTCIMNEHIPMRLADKFFTYLEAGLPMIISEELHYTAEIVNKYDMGIVVSQSDFGNLSEIISRHDREKLITNVKKAREELSMKNHIGRLIEFYELVANNGRK